MRMRTDRLRVAAMLALVLYGLLAAAGLVSDHGSAARRVPELPAAAGPGLPAPVRARVQRPCRARPARDGAGPVRPCPVLTIAKRSAGGKEGGAVPDDRHAKPLPFPARQASQLICTSTAPTAAAAQGVLL